MLPDLVPSPLPAGIVLFALSHTVSSPVSRKPCLRAFFLQGIAVALFPYLCLCCQRCPLYMCLFHSILVLVALPLPCPVPCPCNLVFFVVLVPFSSLCLFQGAETRSFGVKSAHMNLRRITQ